MKPEDITPERTATSIRMIRSERTCSCLLLEGADDHRMYRKFVDDKRCEIFTAFGKEKVLTILNTLENENLPGILAIVDADFDMIEDKPPASPNIFFTDTHDLETMILKSPALEHFFYEHGSKEKIETLLKKRNKKDIRDILLETVMPI